MTYVTILFQMNVGADEGDLKIGDGTTSLDGQNTTTFSPLIE